MVQGEYGHDTGLWWVKNLCTWAMNLLQVFYTSHVAFILHNRKM